MTHCMEADCQKPIYARRLCSAHYQTARIRGTLPPSEAVDAPCAQCGKLMTDRKSARAKFCSPACKELARTAKRRAGIAASNAERKCRWCANPIPASAPSHAQVCSKVCGWKLANQQRAVREKTERKGLMAPCRVCNGEIPADKRANARYCSQKCARRAQALGWQKRAPGYMRQRAYGITPEEFAERLESQGRRCAICRTDTPGGKGGWHVDHCHETGVIRGLLCHHCNIMLGHAKDKVDVLRAAIAYLEE